MPRSPEDAGARARAPRPRDPLPVVAGIVWLRGKIIVQRRPQTAAHGAGRLELPGGKIELGETAATALARELCEEWGDAARDLRVGAHVTTVRHAYAPPGPLVELHVLEVDAGRWPEDWAARLVPAEGAHVLAYAPPDLPTDAFLDADRPVVDRLRRGERGAT